MARHARFIIPGHPQHVIQRGNNREPCFYSEQDYQRYLEDLIASANKYECRVHAYVLMTNHVHMLVTPMKDRGISDMMQALGRRYVYYVNKAYRRTGTLWEGRYKSSLVDSDHYLLTCMRYIELNPVRAGLVDHPAKYRWSSYSANALGVSNSILSKHAEYQLLGRSPEDRQSTYRGLFDTTLGSEEIALQRSALQTGTPLGNDRFRSQIEVVSGRKIGFLMRGRPKKMVSAP